jgi:hypothetical protein
MTKQDKNSSFKQQKRNYRAGLIAENQRFGGLDALRIFRLVVWWRGKYNCLLQSKYRYAIL